MKTEFVKMFRALLPDSISDTSIDINDPETTTLLFIGFIISRMPKKYQEFYDYTDSGMLDDLLIDITARKYQIEW